MKKKLFIVLFFFLLTFIVTGCDKEEVHKEVLITLTEDNTVEVEATSFDYTKMFKITVDGADYTVTEDMIDSSAVQLNEVGDYKVTLTASIVDKVIGDKEYETIYTKDGTLHVVAKEVTEKVVLISETTVSKEIEKGDTTFDFTKLFKITVDGVDVEVKKEWIDTSKVNFNEANTYEVTLTYTLDGKDYTKTISVEVKETVTEKVVLISETNASKEIEKGDTSFDFTKLFKITVDGEAVEVKKEWIDTSKVDFNTPDTYEVTLTYTVDGKDYTKTISVTIKNVLTVDEFKALQGSILFEGQFINHDYAFETDLYEDFLVLFDAKNKAIWQKEMYEGDYIFNAIYVNNNGKIALLTHDINGKVVLERSNDNFDDYFNPFALLEPSDFTFLEEGVWELNQEKAKQTATAITGYNENIEYLHIIQENGVFTQLEIKTKRVTNLDNYIDFEYEYIYDIKEIGTAQVNEEWLNDYVLTAEHETLKQALTAAASAKSYTVLEERTERNVESEDVVGKIYVTEDAIYEDVVGWENGYVALNGLVYPFDYDSETQEFTYGNGLNIESIDLLKALFTFDMFSYALMEYVGDGKYSLRIPELFIMEDAGGFAGAIALLFAIGTDQIRYYPYALDCTITLKDDVLYQVNFTYDYQGYISEIVTLTFSDFNNTVLPIEITGEPESNITIPSSYIGTFKGENEGTPYEVNITADDIQVKIGEDNYDAAIIDYSDYEGFTIYLNNAYYYILLVNDDELMFANEDLTLYFSLNREEVIEPSTQIPSSYIGVFKGEKEGTSYEVTITSSGISVKIGEETYEAIIEEYDSYEGFTIIVNNQTYYLMQNGYDDVIDSIVLLLDDYTFNVTLNREGE